MQISNIERIKVTSTRPQLTTSTADINIIQWTTKGLQRVNHGWRHCDAKPPPSDEDQQNHPRYQCNPPPGGLESRHFCLTLQ